MRRSHGYQNRPHPNDHLKSGLISSEKGVALITGLLLMTVLAAMSIVAIRNAATDITRSKTYAETQQVVNIAEAGIHRALNYFNYDSVGDSPGELANGFDDELDDTNWPAGTFTSIGFGGGGGTYSVVIDDNADGDTNADVDKSVVLTVTGAIDGITAAIEVVIYRPLFNPQHALATEDSLTINGNPTIQGTNGSVHANQNLSLTGNPSVSQTASASGTTTVTGSPTVTGGVSSGAAEANIPVITISDYRPYADIVLTSDGRVEKPIGTIIHTYSTDGKWSTSGGPSCSGKGWNFTSGPPIEWTLGDDCGDEGNYYVEGSIKIGGNPGSPGTPWEVTLMAEDHIVISGNPQFTNFQDSSDSQYIQNIFLLAGTDIEWSGNPSNTIQGMIYAGEQIKLNGNPTINGFIIAADSGATDSTVEENSVSGNPTITYDGDLASPFLDNKVSILSWQKL